jgi:hypothetical protein
VTAYSPGWDHPQRARLLAGLDQESAGVVDMLLKKAAEHDALDEHEACAAICLDLVSNPDMTMVGLAAAVAILAVKMHRAGGDAR